MSFSRWPLHLLHQRLTELTGPVFGTDRVQPGEDGYYRVGLRLWEVGALAPRSIGLREAALPFLRDLCEATDENIQLAVLDERERVYVERLRPARGTRRHQARPPAAGARHRRGPCAPGALDTGPNRRGGWPAS